MILYSKSHQTKFSRLNLFFDKIRWRNYLLNNSANEYILNKNNVGWETMLVTLTPQTSDIDF